MKVICARINYNRHIGFFNKVKLGEYEAVDMGDGKLLYVTTEDSNAEMFEIKDKKEEVYH